MSAPSSATAPLLAERDLDAPLARYQGRAISAAQFLGQAQALAARLPEGDAVNLCQDRYRFALGLAAALLRGQTSLMPPDALPQTLQALLGAGRGGRPAYAMVDDERLDLQDLPRLHVQPDAQAAPLRQIPGIPADLLAVQLLTSGSTGTPQAHAKRWGDLQRSIAAEAQRLAALAGLPSLQGLSLVATVPAQHSYGLESTVLLALLGGACLHAERPFYPADIAAQLAALPAPRALVSTPFHLKALLQAGVALPPLALLLSATAPLSAQLAAQAEAASGGVLVEIYGCTEAGQVATRRSTAGSRWQVLDGLQIHAESDPGSAAGEKRFWVSGGHVPQPQALADALQLHSPEHFELLGRANDLIHVAGKRSSLSHLNHQLSRIEGVDDGAFWMPPEQADGVTRPVLFVVAPRLTPQQLRSALRQQLEPAFVPRQIVAVPSLPRDATGKLGAARLARFAADALSQGGRYFVNADHPAFAGHFPGQPLLPGVALLAYVMRALAEQPERAARLGAVPQISQVKFLSAVRPGSWLQVRLQAQGSGVGFEVLRETDDASPPQTAAKGLLVAGSAS